MTARENGGVWTLAVCLVAGACDSGTETQIALTPLATTKSVEGNRFEVRIEQVIADSLAYGGKRGVYVITDTQTHREYIGVGGVGITELGEHPEVVVTVDDDGSPTIDTEQVKDER